ncbi:DUF317 domain-containing protein [Kitasatospora griseola]|uniref:DUF317 domain-containing protein n=1 Tax=Kitasatospora griseola TaxID=2064 RepID=UPI00381328CD
MSNTPDSPREYWVAPRYLAHADADGSRAVQPLLNVGWASSQDGEGNTFVTAPNLSARLAHLPESDGRVLWKVSAGRDAFAPPEWLVTFDSLTPPEIVADFTTALAAFYTRGPDGYLGNNQDSGVETVLELLATGWKLNPATPFLSYQSPDRFARLHFRDKHLQHSAEMAGDTERWLFEVGTERACWYATASSYLPDHLLQSLTSAITDPAPVRRYMRRIDLDHLPSAATATPTPPSPAEVARIHAATARTAPSRPPVLAAGRAVPPAAVARASAPANRR